MTTKLSGYRSGAVWTVLVVLSHCAILGTAAPAGTVSSKLETCRWPFAVILFHYQLTGRHTHLQCCGWCISSICLHFGVNMWWMFTFYIIMIVCHSMICKFIQRQSPVGWIYLHFIINVHIIDQVFWHLFDGILWIKQSLFISPLYKNCSNVVLLLKVHCCMLCTWIVRSLFILSYEAIYPLLHVGALGPIPYKHIHTWVIF